jgi:hypothetical protein
MQNSRPAERQQPREVLIAFRIFLPVVLDHARIGAGVPQLHGLDAHSIGRIQYCNCAFFKS